MLLDCGAARTVVSKEGFTPADRAALNGHAAVVKALQAARYPNVHKQREFVRNLLVGAGMLSLILYFPSYAVLGVQRGVESCTIPVSVVAAESDRTLVACLTT